MKSCLDCSFLIGGAKLNTEWHRCLKEQFPATFSPSRTLFDMAEACPEYKEKK